MAEGYLNRLHPKSYQKRRIIFSVRLSILLIINAKSGLLSIFLIYSFRMNTFAFE